MSTSDSNHSSRRYKLWRFKRFGKRSPLQPDDNQASQAEDLSPQQDQSFTPEDYVPDSADFLPSPPRAPSPLARFPSAQSIRPATFLLLLCLAVSLGNWLNLWPGVGGTWASREKVWNEGEWWRLLSALFTHANVGHLLSNTPLFLIFGWYLRDFFGLIIFPWTALLIGVISNLLTLWTYSPDTELLGASGMLYGMVALWLVLYVHFETSYTHAQRVFRAVGVSLLLLFPTTFQTTTSYAAHGFGFGVGLLLGVFLAPFVRLKPQRQNEK